MSRQQLSKRLHDSRVRLCQFSDAVFTELCTIRMQTANTVITNQRLHFSTWASSCPHTVILGRNLSFYVNGRLGTKLIVPLYNSQPIFPLQFNTAAASSGATSSGTKTWLSKTLSSIKESATSAAASAATTSGEVASGNSKEQTMKKSSTIDVIHNRGAPSSS